VPSVQTLICSSSYCLRNISLRAGSAKRRDEKRVTVRPKKGGMEGEQKSKSNGHLIISSLLMTGLSVCVKGT